MANPFYDPGALRAVKVNDLFDTIARRYDRINDLQSLGLHRRWKQRLVRMAGKGSGRDALDLCCGTGDVVLGLARQGYRATGLDFSGEMLGIARARASQAGPLSLQLLQGDALKIPATDASFDVVTISYGLRNLASVEAGLKEMRRVTKPGGHLLILDFGKPRHWVWRHLYFAYLQWIVPGFGRWFCGNASAYAYILESLKPYPAQAGIADLVRKMGFVRVGIVNLLGGIMSIHFADQPR